MVVVLMRRQAAAGAVDCRMVVALDKEYFGIEANTEKLKSELLKAHAELNPVKRELERLQKEIEHSNQFVESNGALFKKKVGGG